MKYTVQDGFPYYIELVESADYKHLFSSKDVFEFLRSITEEEAGFRYAPGKWSIKQITGHITDHERIMMYRALRFSRNDKTILPGYDQDLLVNNSRFDQLSFDDLITDFGNVRIASNSSISSLTETQLQLKGTANRQELTVEEFLKAAIGHQLHHVEIIKNKYLK